MLSRKNSINRAFLSKNTKDTNVSTIKWWMFSNNNKENDIGKELFLSSVDIDESSSNSFPLPLQEDSWEGILSGISFFGESKM